MEEAATSVQLNVKQEGKKARFERLFFPCFDQLSVVYVLLKVWYWKWKEMQESMY